MNSKHSEERVMSKSNDQELSKASNEDDLMIEQSKQSKNRLRRRSNINLKLDDVMSNDIKKVRLDKINKVVHYFNLEIKERKDV